jgi:glycosyltransferase involved in cell wall biosynthesis/predicted glycoside hydrolase/deacetylase ChbG (UPF0249 family)
MAPDRRLVVNADDFGRTPAVTGGVIATHERGIVTSASLMVRWPAAREAARYARAHRSLGVGLHVDVGEWRWRGGAWHREYEVVDAGSRDALEAEVSAQLGRFRELVGEGPTHLDSHQQAHRREPLRSVLRDLADELQVPLRHETPEVRHRTDFHGRTRTGRAIPEAITPRRLIDWLSTLGPDVVELRCHPATGADGDDYGQLGLEEVRTLCDAEVRRAIDALGVELCTFRAIVTAPPEGRRALASGDAPRAAAIFAEAAGRHRDQVWPWLWLARARHAAGDAAGALDAMLSAVGVEPRSLAALECVLELLGSGDARARDAYRVAASRVHGSLVVSLGALASALGSLRSAASARAAEALGLAGAADGVPGHEATASADARAEAARCLALGDALGAWARIEAAGPGGTGCHLLAEAGEALRREGHLHASVRAFTRALELAPHDPDIRAARDGADGELQVLAGSWSLPRLRAGGLRTHPGRVLHVVGTSLPGVQCGYTLRTHAIARAQRAAGIDAHVVTELGFPGDAPGAEGVRCEVIDGVPYYRLHPELGVPVRLDARLTANAEALHALVRDIGPEVLHAASDYRNALLALSVGRAAHVPVVYEMRGFWEDTWRAGLGPSIVPGERYEWLQAWELGCALAADCVVTLSDAMRDDLVARGLDRNRIAVAPNGVDVEAFAPRVRDAALAETLAIAPDDVVVGYVSTLNAYEGIDCLLRAFARLASRNVVVRGLIVGDGPDRDRLQALAADLGLSARVHFAGRVRQDRVAAWHSLLDVFVVPRADWRVSRLVTPLKPLEAMAMEKTVVASGLDALQEIVADGVTGRVFAPGDPVALASVLAPLVADAALRRRLGAAAREFVLASRTWPSIALRYRDIYTRLAPEPASAQGETP